MASTSTPKPDEKSSTPADSKPEQSQNNKTAGALEEDDEFEDFPVEDWPAEETEAANQQGNNTSGGTAADHLWEESWDDDDTSDDFSAQLREELKKVDAAKRR